MSYAQIVDLLGKTITDIQGNKDSDELIFVTHDGEVYKMYHEQDCCEHVSLDDIVGDLQDLIGNPLISAEEVSNIDEPPRSEHEESYTWTFYKLATIKGSVTLRWYGSSNGYYSESVTLRKIS